jgi:O-antigen/teichoic acid export membrane protein
MTTIALVSRVPFGLRFSLDAYTTWYNSPNAAIYFWSIFLGAVLLIVVSTLWFFRRMRR